MVRVSRLHAFFLSIGAIIGTGIFTVTGLQLSSSISPLTIAVSWGAAMVVSLLGAVAYGFISKRFNDLGGESEYLFRFLGIKTSAPFTFLILLSGFILPIVLNMQTIIAYLSVDIALQYGPLVKILIIVVALLLYYYSESLLFNSQYGFAIITLLAVVSISGVLLFFKKVDISYSLFSPSESVPPNGAIFSPAIFLMAYFSFAGWNNVIYIGRHIKGIRSAVLPIMILSIVFVGVLYGFFMVSIYRHLPTLDHHYASAELPFIIFEQLTGSRVLIQSLVVILILSSIFSIFISGIKITQGIAEKLFVNNKNIRKISLVLFLVLLVTTLQIQDLSLLFQLSSLSMTTVSSLVFVSFTIIIFKKYGINYISKHKWQFISMAVFTLVSVVLGVHLFASN